jgi:hypothetical protein
MIRSQGIWASDTCGAAESKCIGIMLKKTGKGFGSNTGSRRLVLLNSDPSGTGAKSFANP